MKTCDECGRPTNDLYPIQHDDGEVEHFCIDCYNWWNGIEEKPEIVVFT